VSSRLASDPVLRPVGVDDAELLLGIYASTRAEELAVVPWSDAQRDAFLRQQFAAQSTSWRAQHPDADWSVVEVDGRPAGRLYVDRSGDELSIIDIALLPEFRGAGLGTALLRDILAEADERQVPVSIYVEVTNRARELYIRLGFARLDSMGLYDLYRRRPGGVLT
jgi:ribosomal protein S18 acetylase RimI-like enzyme